jgi:methylase of polypeptide subunit release factors
VNGEDRMPEAPVLRDVKTIENRDALITWDRRELERDQYGRPITRWDGETMKKHPVTGKDVPDETAQVEVYRYVNPKPAKWPKADFIVGNPPFIGGNAVRHRLGAAYFDALSKLTPTPESADFVMHWWDLAAAKTARGEVRQFGFVTTNSLPQAFNRRVVAKHLESKPPLSLIFAISDHPWVSEKGDAAVRISMSVGRQGTLDGRLLLTDRRRKSDHFKFTARVGKILSDLTIGPDVAGASPLRANRGISFRGVLVVGDGFRLPPEVEKRLREEEPGISKHIETLICGRDLTERVRCIHVLDFYGLTEHQLQDSFPATYSYMSETILPVRMQNNRRSYRELWWIFAEPRSEFRTATRTLSRHILTPRTAKHRFFSFSESCWLPESEVVAVALDDALTLGTLSSRTHIIWATAAGAHLGVGNDPRYTNTRCFDPFPFPDTTDEGLKGRIRDAAEKLDALRKDVLARHEDLTLTKLYNVLEALRAAEKAGTVLSDKDRHVATRGCVSLIRQYHDTIDAAVAEAYGWPTDLTDEEILERLVALNKERAAEEAKGIVKWLRPEFQAPGYAAPKEQKTLALPEQARPSADILEWPAALPEQFTAVAAVVDRAARPIAANDVARAFKGKRASTIAPVLDTLAGMGRLRKLEDGRYAA